MWTIFKVFIEFVTILLLLLATLTRDQTHTFCFGRQKSEPLDHLCSRLSRTTNKKRCPFHHRGLECKSRKSGDTWSNRQIWPWSTEWSRAKANRVLPREHTGHSKHPHPTTQEKTLHMDITRRSTPKSDWLYCWQLKTEKLYIVGKKKRPGAVTQTMNLLQKSEKWKSFSRVQLCATPRTIQSVEFSRPGYWSG